MPRDYALDTNALSALLADPFEPERIAARVRAADARLILIGQALAECYEGGDEPVARQFERIVRLVDGLPPDLVACAREGSDVLRAELRGERFVETPVLDAEGLAILAEAREGREQFIRKRAERRRTTPPSTVSKDAMAEIDRRAATEVLKVERRVIALGAEKAIAELRDWFRAGAWPLDVLIPDNAERQRVAADERCARAHAVMFGLFWVNALGAVLKLEQPRPYPDVLTNERGVWDDMRIAANAAYCAGILTHDGRFTRRLELVRSAGLTFVRPLRLADLGL